MCARNEIGARRCRTSVGFGKHLTISNVIICTIFNLVVISLVIIQTNPHLAVSSEPTMLLKEIVLSNAVFILS